MRRRDFLLKSAAATTATAALVAQGVGPAGAVFAQATPPPKPKKNTFKLKYAPHFGMFKAHAGDNLLDQLRFMADAGFTALEDNGLMKRPVADQEAIGKTLAQLNMTMGVFVIDAGDNWKASYATGKPEFQEPFLKACRDALDTAKRVNAKWATVVPGYYERNLPIGIQTGHVIDILKRGADILAPNNLTMVLEPLSDNPDLFLRYADQGYALCRAVGSPACKILYDMYHTQRNEGRIIEHMNWAWEEIAYFQVGDVPGRKEPGTGEMNYQGIFKHIHQKAAAAGKTFVLGMEHGNFGPGVEGERALIEAYVRADGF